MNNSLIDVPVAIIFFNRSDTLAKVFEQVKIAKPSLLFLVQDGARDGNSKDVESIQKCREVVNDIDWECEVVQDYSEVNLGCGARVSSGITNAFKKVDRLIILEDDCVPSQSMFRFCKEILEKYKDDERINMISGMNHLETYDLNGDSYFFCKTGSIWGWATWKRVWGNYDYNMTFLNDQFTNTKFKNLNLPKHYLKDYIQTGNSRKKVLTNGGRLTAWTYQFGMLRHLFSQLVIVPEKNLISNIGINNESTHGVDSLLKLPKGLRMVFNINRYELHFPLRHPKYIIEDTLYDKKVHRIMGGPPIIKFYRRLEGITRNILSRDKVYFQKLYNKLVKNNKGNVCQK